MGRFPGRWMMGFFSVFPVFLTPPVTHTALPPVSLTFPSPSVRPPEIDSGDEDEEDEDEEGGLAMDSMPWIASRVLGEAGASSLSKRQYGAITQQTQTGSQEQNFTAEKTKSM